MSTKVFVDGQEGTTGLKIFEYLSQRADVEILRIEEAKRKDIDERRRLINASDVTFLCLPDVASRESRITPRSALTQRGSRTSPKVWTWLARRANRIVST